MIYHLLHIPSSVSSTDRSYTLGGCGQSAPSQGLLYLAHQEGQATIVSHALKHQVQNINFLGSLDDRLEAPFLYPAPTRRIESLQEQQAKNRTV